MARIGVGFMAVSLMVSASAQAPVERPSLHLTAVKYVWTTSVDRQTRQFAKPLSTPVPPGPIYLWLTVRGDADALEWLRKDAKGTLPVFVFWMRRSPDGFYSDPADVVELSVGAKDSLGLLGAQLAQEGSFSWRVWSGKAFAGPGAWKVRIVDHWGAYVLCPTATVVDAECELEIEVTE